MQDFNVIYSEHYKRILRFVNSKVNSLDLSEEITNDVFMKVYKNLDRFDINKASMSTWITNIAKNTCIDHYRKKKLQYISIDKTYNDRDSFSNKDIILTSSDPCKEMVSGQTMDIIQDQISSLNGNLYTIADMLFNQQLSYDEISMKLDMPLGTVKATIFRIRKILTEKINL